MQGRRPVDIGSAAVFDDSAVDEPDDPLRVLSDVSLVRDDHDRAPELVEPFEDLEHFMGRVRVEIAGRFVCEHQRGVARDCSCYRDALLLATRQFRRHVLEPVAETDGVHCFFRAPTPFALANAR